MCYAENVIGGVQRGSGKAPHDPVVTRVRKARVAVRRHSGLPALVDWLLGKTDVTVGADEVCSRTVYRRECLFRVGKPARGPVALGASVCPCRRRNG